jgi:hypothetical protein
MKSLSEWMDLNDVANHLDQIKEESVSVQRREVLRVARAELQRFKSKGLTPEQFDSNRFFDGCSNFAKRLTLFRASAQFLPTGRMCRQRF